jgi:signal transduction histidine kinase/HAMP domain-containing protein
LSLKTKLRLAILGLVLAVVLAYSWLYISLLTRKEIEADFDLGQYITKQIGQKADQALDDSKAALPEMLLNGDPDVLRLTVERALTVHPGLNSLLDSIPGYSYTVFDAAVVGTDGVIIAHSKSEQRGRTAPPRYTFEPLLNSGVLVQLKVAFGPEQIYEISNPLDLTIDGKPFPFGSLRVGISSVYLGNSLRPQILQALALVALFVALTLALGWIVTSVLLRPLESINVSLDLMTRGQFDAVPAAPARPDEFGEVASKLTLLGQQFRDVRENMAQVMHGLEEALLLFTRDGRAILASDRVQELLHLEPDEILGRSVEDVFASQPALAVLVSQSVHQGLPFLRREVELDQGRRVTLSVQFIAGLAPEGASQNSNAAAVALVSLRDAESVRRLESQIEMSNRLAAISRLTSGVAHEVRNPLNAIVLHLEALKNKLVDPGEAITEHLAIIAREIYRLDRVVRTFLDFTRPVRLNLQETDVNALVQEVVGLAGVEADARHIQVNFEPNGIRPVVRVDRDLIKQAILNVVLNGCQATPDGGRLDLSERIVNGVVELSVADQGPGISPEIQDKIFDLYFTTREKGSGIGLPLAFRAFQLHNGTVEFQNRAEGGAEFRLCLPLASPAASSAARS